jgi:hypothetical protein
VTNVAVLAGLLLSFATCCTAHVIIAVRLARRRPRYRGLLALVVPPLAPVWAHGQGWRLLAYLWFAGVAGYALARAAASLLVP